MMGAIGLDGVSIVDELMKFGKIFGIYFDPSFHTFRGDLTAIQRF